MPNDPSLDTRPESSFKPRPANGPRIVAAVVIALLLSAAGWYAFLTYKKKMAPVPPPAPVAVTELPRAAEPPPAVNLEEGNALVRKLGSTLSTAPELAKWLAEPDILRRLVAAVNLVAEGNTPRSVLGFLAPGGSFEVVRRKQEIHATDATYARFDKLTEVVSAVDPVALGTHVTEVETFANAALGEIAKPGTVFRDVLHRALGNLNGVELPTSAPQLLEKGAGYAYADPKLESLSAAQKCLLRMGPANAKTVQAWTRKLDAALGKDGAATSARPRP